MRQHYPPRRVLAADNYTWPWTFGDDWTLHESHDKRVRGDSGCIRSAVVGIPPVIDVENDDGARGLVDPVADSVLTSAGSP